MGVNEQLSHFAQSAIYKGVVKHERFTPTRHAFDYTMYFFWLKLSELYPKVPKVNYFSVNQAALYQFKTQDYFPESRPRTPSELETCVRNKMVHLGAEKITGDIFFMGQIRALGIFFSPVNFYFHRPVNAESFDWMLAEVSNTPWNQRHYYLVDMHVQADADKKFHVSPFNPVDMIYRWQITQPSESFDMALSCIKETKHFTASMSLQREELTSQSMKRLLVKMPSTTLFSVIGIYWQALKLFLKRTPFYSHPGPVPSSVQENNNVSK